jgi:hypothetical protein
MDRLGVHEPMQDLFASQSFRERGVSMCRLRVALDRHKSGGADNSAPLFTAAEFELWCRQRPASECLLSSRGEAA